MQQAQQPRFSVSGGSSSSVSADEHEEVIRELTRGHELTARLRAEAMRALRGQGQQAEDTAAFILQEVSRAFTVCLSIMSSPARAPPPPEMLAEPGRRATCRDENVVPRREIVTYDPYSDGYVWRKYGQKRITNTSFPRCYFRCSYHRERGCPATKKVQQNSNGDPPQYVVVYVNEHTCDTAAWEPAEAAAPAVADRAANPLQDLQRRQGRGGLLGVQQEEHERQALVSSLATVLGARSPSGSSSSVVAGGFGHEPPPEQQQQGASASVVDPSGGGELPRLDVDAELDVMDYDVTGALYFGDSYGLRDDDGLPF